MHGVSDRELVGRFVGGYGEAAEDAFRQLYRRHTPRVYAITLRMSGGRRSDAEDIVQETWIRAVGRVDRFEWRSSLLTWLTSIAIHCALEAARRRPAGGSDHDVLELGEGARGISRERSLVSRELSLDLDRAIAALPDGYRHAIVLHDVEGYTHPEIAALMGITDGTSRSQLFHARRALRVALTTKD